MLQKLLRYYKIITLSKKTRKLYTLYNFNNVKNMHTKSGKKTHQNSQLYLHCITTED